MNANERPSWGGLVLFREDDAESFEFDKSERCPCGWKEISSGSFLIAGNLSDELELIGALPKIPSEGCRITGKRKELPERFGAAD